MADHVNTWLQNAVDNGVRSLELYTYSCNSTLPQTIFEAKLLVKLCLMGQFQLKPQVNRDNKVSSSQKVASQRGFRQRDASKIGRAAH